MRGRAQTSPLLHLPLPWSGFPATLLAWEAVGQGAEATERAPFIDCTHPPACRVYIASGICLLFAWVVIFSERASRVMETATGCGGGGGELQTGPCWVERDRVIIWCCEGIRDVLKMLLACIFVVLESQHHYHYFQCHNHHVLLIFLLIFLVSICSRLTLVFLLLPSSFSSPHTNFFVLILVFLVILLVLLLFLLFSFLAVFSSPSY